MWRAIPFLLCFIAACNGFNNPILDYGADPTCVVYNGYYHLAFTEINRVSVWRSRTLEGLRNAEVNVLFEAPSAPDPACCDVWAPDFVSWNNRWYIYFAVGPGGDEWVTGHRMHVLESDGQDPFGSYTYRGRLQMNEDLFGIDGTVVVLRDVNYFVWVCTALPDVDFRLCIAEMSDPLTLAEGRHVIARATEPWEITPYPDGPRVNEGPTVLRNGNRTFLFFSCHSTDQDEYCLGYLEYTGGDPTSSNSWQKSSDCVFKQRPEKNVYGPGHNYFFPSLDGSQVWNFYHAIPVSGGGGGARNLRAQSISWNSDGTPNLGVPAGYDEWLDPPSGE